MQWQTVAEAKAKDRIEWPNQCEPRRPCRQVGPSNSIRPHTYAILTEQQLPSLSSLYLLAFSALVRPMPNRFA